MTCVAPKQEWTIETINDNSSERNTLIFCLTIAGGTITGIVSERRNGDVRFLSIVSGTDQPVAGLNASFRTLNFVWDTCRVILAGNALLAATPRRFIGRFASFAVAGLAPAEDFDAVTIQSPGDGDTGTGNGQQT
jgi:hypothetical protein